MHHKSEETSKIFYALIILILINFLLITATIYQMNIKFDQLSDEFSELGINYSDCVTFECREEIIKERDIILERLRTLSDIKSVCSINSFCLVNSGWEKV